MKGYAAPRLRVVTWCAGSLRHSFSHGGERSGSRVAEHAPRYVDERRSPLDIKKVERMSEPDRPPQHLIVALAALTAVSGIVDAVSYLGLGRVFTANMTGNVLLIGFGIAGAPGFSIAASAAALATLSRGRSRRRPSGTQHPRSPLLAPRRRSCSRPGSPRWRAAIAGSVAVLDAGWPRLTVIALLSFPMGIRNLGGETPGRARA